MHIEAYITTHYQGQYRFAYDTLNREILNSNRIYDFYWHVNMRQAPTLHELNEVAVPGERMTQYAPMIKARCDLAIHKLFLGLLPHNSVNAVHRHRLDDTTKLEFVIIKKESP